MEPEIPSHIGSYIFREKLGAGAFSSVYLALDTKTQMQVAIKVITKGKFDEEKLKREIDLLKTLDHPFCVSFFESLEDSKFFYLVMEYVEGRTVFRLISAKGSLPEWLCRHIFCQLISALEYLHEEKKMVHRDLKAENIMIDRYGNIRLIDFGLSNRFSGDVRILHTACGSPAYAPPEMFKGEDYNSSADLWSAGVVLYALSVGKLPFEDKNLQNLIKKIVSAEPDYPDTMNPQLVDLLHRMLMKDLSCRMSIRKIRSHPWFTQYHYASLMDADYGFASGMRIHDDSDGDIAVLTALDNLGYDSLGLLEKARKDVFTSEVTPFRIIHRSVITKKMKGMYQTAERCDTSSDQASAQLPQSPEVAHSPIHSLLVGNMGPSVARRQTHMLVKRKVCCSLVDNRTVVAQSTALVGTKNSAETQSLKTQHYRNAVLTSLMRKNPTQERYRRPRGLSFSED